jgi:hypothetical protein
MHKEPMWQGREELRARCHEMSGSVCSVVTKQYWQGEIRAIHNVNIIR